MIVRLHNPAKPTESVSRGPFVNSYEAWSWLCAKFSLRADTPVLLVLDQLTSQGIAVEFLP